MDTAGAAGMGFGGGLAQGGEGGTRVDNPFCESVAEGGAGGAIDCSTVDASPVVTSPAYFRYDLLEKQKFTLQFDRPVCDAADNTSLAPAAVAGEPETKIVTKHVGVGEYEVTFDDTGWRPLDAFNLTVRAAVSDTQCLDFMAENAAITVQACHPDGWPTSIAWPNLAPACRPAPPSAPDNALDKNDCQETEDKHGKGIPLPFVCGKAAVEGSMPGLPAPVSDPEKPPVSELHAHAYRLEAYMDGDYKITLDGTGARTATIGKFVTIGQTADKTCEEVIDCAGLGAYVRLDIGETCGTYEDTNLHLIDYSKKCIIEETLTLTKGEVRYLTVRPDADSGCGPNKNQPCDYNYALWVRGPDGN
jgi:hypothetical protein